MRFLKNISLYIVISIFVVIITNIIDSYFLYDYLRDNIVGILLTLLAINTATLGLLASKMKDILIKYPYAKFTNTLKEMRFSLKEQILLIVCSIVTLIIFGDNNLEIPCKETICSVMLFSIFIYAITILKDTGNSVFVIVEQIQEFNDK